MQKLTKEQAEWLIESIDELKSIINNCTEKEFPEFKTSYGSDCELSVYLPKHAMFNNCISIDLGDDETNFEMTFEEFKRFAQYMNKVVEWINDKDCK